MFIVCQSKTEAEFIKAFVVRNLVANPEVTEFNFPKVYIRKISAAEYRLTIKWAITLPEVEHEWSGFMKGLRTLYRYQLIPYPDHKDIYISVPPSEPKYCRAEYVKYSKLPTYPDLVLS